MARKTGGEERAAALQRLKAALKTGDVGNFYVFFGEEAFLKEHYWRMLEKKLLDGPAAEFNFHRFNAETLSPQALSEAVDAMPMMAERTLIRVDDVDFFKQAEGAREQYRTIFADLPEYCCLVLYYDTAEWKPNGTMRKLNEVFQTKCERVEFGKQSERDLVSWIQRHFKAHDKWADDQLCQYLIFLTDGTMTTLAGEIEKVASYAKGQEITKGDMDAVVIPALSAQTFDISNAIADANYDAALRKLQDLYAMQTEPILILGAIGSQLRRLLYAKTVMNAGQGQQALMELTGMKSYPAGLTMNAARRVGDGFCRRAVELCLQADRDMKASRDDPERVLEVLLAALAQEARSGTR